MIPRRQALRITAVAGLSLVAGGGLTRAILRQAALHRVRETRTQLGTLVTISAVHPDRAEAREMVAAGFREMERLESLLSRYREDTPLSRLNREGVLVDPPPELSEVLDAALAYSSLSEGAFDFTVAPLVDLYRAGFARTGAPPPDRDFQQALDLVGYRGVKVEGNQIAFDRPGMAVTLDGIAKGYVVDRTVEVLKRGTDQVLVDAGGDLASSGAGPDGGGWSGAGSDADGWTVAIQDPRDPRRDLGVLALRDGSVATSGDYVQHLTPDRRLHHILDPRTGESPLHTSAVTVLTSSAMQADALSTAVFVLGPEEGLRLLARTEGAEGMIITKRQEMVMTEGLELLRARV